jgi:cytidylate kinase
MATVENYKKGVTIGFVGLSGSGKTTIANAVGEELNRQVIDVGRYFRAAMTEWGKQVQEADVIPLWLDRNVDNKSKKLFGNEVIMVGRTLTHIARTMHLNSDTYIGIGVFCSGDTIAKRARPKWNEKKGLPSDTPLPSLTHVRNALRIRNANDMERYRQLYGVTQKQELYGKPPNDILVNTDALTIQEELNIVLGHLYAVGAIARVKFFI